MQVRVVSDLHFEFAPDGGRICAHRVTRGEFDVLVVAGDLTSARGLRAGLRLICEETDKPVVYVHGNHEFYGSDRASVLEDTRRSQEEFPHLHFLDRRVVTIDGQRFAGATLWFQKSSAPEWAMNDFSLITGFRSWVYNENGLARSWLAENVQPGDVVVTHYLPSPKSVHPKYVGNALNPFFVCDVERLITEKRPALWIHGHTHESVRYQLGGTEVACNPFGYSGHEVNQEFDPELTIEVHP
jgi:Icc-related predicted phosphoesterase